MMLTTLRGVTVEFDFARPRLKIFLFFFFYMKLCGGQSYRTQGSHQEDQPFWAPDVLSEDTKGNQDFKAI